MGYQEPEATPCVLMDLIGKSSVNASQIRIYGFIRPIRYSLAAIAKTRPA